MAQRLRDFFDGAVVARIAAQVAAAYPGFARRAFVRDARAGLATLDLMDRGRHIAAALRRHLPADPAVAIGILTRSLGPPLATTGGHGMAPFLYLPHALFVADHGRGCFEVSMRALHALTQRFTAEFSLRPFLEAEPRRTFAELARWATDPSPHVRRAVSEGVRPRLPWAGRLESLRRDPTPALALLERLKDDPHPYVRRSVANCLNDVAKDHPGRVTALARRWLRGASAARRRLVAQGLRTLIKRGDPAALGLLGCAPAPGLDVARVQVAPAVVRIGGHVEVRARVLNRGPAAARVVVDLGVHFVGARGQPRLKVFKGRTLCLRPGEAADVAKRISLRQHTTRRHYPGAHVVDLRLNGAVRPAGTFRLRG